jgi:GDPmannose 4,6-dehydratase
LDAERDWGYAPEYVEGMWRMLQQKEPDDYVLATGETHTVRGFAELAFREVGIELNWESKGVDEKGVDKKTGKTLVEIDPNYFRPAEVERLIGNPRKAEEKLGWKAKTKYKELVKLMVEADLKQTG